MPLFDFHCDTCDREFEALQRTSEATIAHCPRCNAATSRRLMPVPARTVSGDDGGVPDVSQFGPPAGGCCGGGCSH